MKKTGQELERVRQERVCRLKRELLSKTGKGKKEAVRVIENFGEGVIEALFIGGSVVRVSSSYGFRDFYLKKTGTEMECAGTHDIQDLCEYVVNTMVCDYLKEFVKQTRVFS